MEDGLIGEFAKNKIDKVITILNQEKLNKEDLKYCEKIIPIIGEPIVKNQLQKMLDSKKLPEVGEIDKIHEEIAELQSRLKNLEVKDDKK
jgi:polyhydroxyalkanoate synthesis regulator phasin